MPNIEIITFNKEECLICAKYSINRVELVKNLEEGGLTPELSVIKECCEIKIPVHVMIREKSSNFYLTKKEQKQLINIVKNIMQNSNPAGIVIGSLNKNKRVDFKFIKKVKKALPKNTLITFHRAIDESSNYKKDLKKLLNKKHINFVLTSLAKPTALKGIEELAYVQTLNNLQKIQLGSGLEINNVHFFKNSFIQNLHFGNGVRTDGILSTEKILKLKATLK